MVPLLLEFGTLPRVAAATSGFLIFFTTWSNIVHYLMVGTVEPDIGYTVSMFVVAMLGAMVGLMGRDTTYMQRNSHLVVLLLALLLIISGLLLAYRGLYLSPLEWGFAPFCPS